ncbi:MAG: hypothetical protein H0T46_30645 [Deltaproteobacteria bacterium]|nr:hypothetical protein [Deltaproteobacteria bacterium]
MKRSGELSAMTALAIVACVGIGAYVWLTFTREGPPAWVKDPGVTRGSLIVGDYVVLLDAVSTEEGAGTRVAVLDATTGKRRKAMAATDFAGCRVATSTRMWCAAAGLHLWELPSLEPLLSVEGAIVGGGHGAPVSGAWLLDGTTAYQLLAGGRAVAIDPATLAITPAATVPPALTGKRQPFVMAMHDGSCERFRATWPTAIGSHACESAAEQHGLYVVTTTSPAGRAIGIDRSTGAIRWEAGPP